MFDNDIPVPTRKHPNFRAMNVGESIFFPHDGPIMKCKAYLYAMTVQKHSDVYRFMGRSVTEKRAKGVRIWRVR